MMGEVNDEAALGFAGGTSTGPLPYVRLGYRFYDPASGHFTMADPSGRDLHPTLYAGGDPINSIDPWGLEQYNMIGFDRAAERLHVQVWDDMRPDRPIEVLSYTASSRVLTPADRAYQPVAFDPDGPGPREGYHRFPEPYPASPEEGWEVYGPYHSENEFVGPAIRTNAYRYLDTYSTVGDNEFEWETSGEVRAQGYFIHGGIGTTTEGCIKMADADVIELQEVVTTGRASRLYTLEGGKPE